MFFYDAPRRLIAYNIGTGHTGKYEVWIKKAILVIKTPGEQQWTNIMTGYRAFSYEFVKTIPDGIRVLRTISKLYRNFLSSTWCRHIG